MECIEYAHTIRLERKFDSSDVNFFFAAWLGSTSIARATTELLNN